MARHQSQPIHQLCEGDAAGQLHHDHQVQQMPPFNDPILELQPLDGLLPRKQVCAEEAARHSIVVGAVL